MPWRFPPYPAESITGHNVNKKENMYCPMVRRDLKDNLHQFIPDDTIYYRTHTQLWGLPVGEHDIRQPANGSPPWFPESSTKNCTHLLSVQFQACELRAGKPQVSLLQTGLGPATDFPFLCFLNRRHHPHVTKLHNLTARFLCPTIHWCRSSPMLQVT